MLHFHLLLSFFSVEKFLLRKKREKKRQIIKKRQIKKIKKIPSKTTNISIIHLQNRMIPINNHSLIIESKNRLHRQCEAYDDYQSKCLIFIYSDEKNYVEKWKNKKFIRWKTTNISIIHLQNQMIPIKYNQSLYKSKNRLHRQCEAYDYYQSKCFIFIYSDDKNYVEKWKNKKLLRWKTTNISIIHLQNWIIPIIYNQSLYQSKIQLHRQCEAYDDYQSKCFIFIHSYHFFQLKNFWLRKKRQIKRQIIKKKTNKKKSKNHMKNNKYLDCSFTELNNSNQ